MGDSFRLLFREMHSHSASKPGLEIDKSIQASEAFPECRGILFSSYESPFPFGDVPREDSTLGVKHWYTIVNQRPRTDLCLDCKIF